MIAKNKNPSHPSRAASAARMRERWADPEWRAKMSAAQRKRWEDPEFRARATAHLPGNNHRGNAPVKGTCVYCGRPGTERDHDVPTQRGGTNDPSNIVIACSSCNASKGNLTGAEYRELLRLKELR